MTFRRPLGTMIAYGFPRPDLGIELAIADRLGAQVLEILPLWKALPDPVELRNRVEASGLRIWSAHGCWGAQSIRAARVDLADLDDSRRMESLDDLKRCIDWGQAAGIHALVVHPGGLSDSGDLLPRRDALAGSLRLLADHARDGGPLLCVENMPAGVHPGSRMADLFGLVSELRLPEVALALDTGHARIVSDPATETKAAGSLLMTTHVHDNDGRQDSHEIPGDGVIDWPAWREALDEVEYRGPIMLECIRKLRESPDRIDETLLERLRILTGP